MDLLPTEVIDSRDDPLLEAWPWILDFGRVFFGAVFARFTSSVVLISRMGFEARFANYVGNCLAESWLSMEIGDWSLRSQASGEMSRCFLYALAVPKGTSSSNIISFHSRMVVFCTGLSRGGDQRRGKVENRVTTRVWI